MESWEVPGWFGDYLDALNRHDLTAIREFVDERVKRAHLPSGVEAWIADLASLFEAFPDWRWRRIQLVVEDDRIAAHLRGSGTHVGPYRGVAPTRRHANVAEFGIYRLTNGRIVEYVGSTDDELMAQLRR